MQRVKGMTEKIAKPLDTRRRFKNNTIKYESKFTENLKFTRKLVYRKV